MGSSCIIPSQSRHCTKTKKQANKQSSSVTQMCICTNNPFPVRCQQLSHTTILYKCSDGLVWVSAVSYILVQLLSRRPPAVYMGECHTAELVRLSKRGLRLLANRMLRSGGSMGPKMVSRSGGRWCWLMRAAFSWAPGINHTQLSHTEQIICTKLGPSSQHTHRLSDTQHAWAQFHEAV